MASTLKPFRQYNEHEVINLYSLKPTVAPGTTHGPGEDLVSMKMGGAAAQWDAGRLVGMDNAEAKGSGGDWDPVNLNKVSASASWSGSLKSYLGADYNQSSTDGSHVGQVGYPNADLTCKTIKSAATGVLGVTLLNTMAYDENNEKLLYYRTKATENHCVLPGQAVPVLKRGLLSMVVDGASSAGAAVYSRDGIVGNLNEMGLISITSDNSATAIGEIIAVLDVDAKICLVALDV